MGELFYWSLERECFVASLTFMTVATNQYLEYWFDLYESSKSQNSNSEVHFQVFTDRKKDAEAYCVKHKTENVSVIEIPNYRWPEATLLRYEIFSELGQYEQSGIYAHIDADMIFSDLNEIRRRLELHDKELLFVVHPGFFRPQGVRRVIYYFKNPLNVIKDLYKFLRDGGLGAWEVNKLSRAYVPYGNRHKYCCGGIWFGKRESFIQMCSQLSQEVKLDIAQGIIAKWHDESFLNKYCVMFNDIDYLGPEFCFVEHYAQLRGLEPLIEAVEKGANKTR